MARVKPKNSITNRQQAEAAMARINSIDSQFAQWDLAEANAITKVRESFSEVRRKGGFAGLETERTLLIKELQAWAEVDSAHWEKKTLETPFGSLGFRVTSPAVTLIKSVAGSFKKAIELLRAKNLKEFIRETPEVDKEAILAAERAKTLDEKLLKECGLKVNQDDEFWLESAASKDLEEAAKKLKAA